MNPVIMAPQILLLDRGPADGTLLSLQCYSSIRLKPPKNLSASMRHFSRLRMYLAGSAAAILEVDDIDYVLGIVPILCCQGFGQTPVGIVGPALAATLFPYHCSCSLRWKGSSAGRR
jgi:hypothetical protein